MTTLTTELIESLHPLRDIVVEGQTFDAQHRMRITTLRQPGRVLFTEALVTIRYCRFDGTGLRDAAGILMRLGKSNHATPALVTIRGSAMTIEPERIRSCWFRFRRHVPIWRTGLRGQFDYRWCAVCERPLFFPHMRARK